ncbi:MAG: LacI family DNA-binding transcriptional regulator [Syntrophothermus sp.]
MARPTIRDVARRAGVSTATVSYVINRSVPVSEDTRSRVERAIRELSYRPSGLARGLAGQRIRILGVAALGFNDLALSDSFFAEVIKGIGEATYRLGYSFMLASPSLEEEAGRSSIGIFFDKGVEGLILLNGREDEPELSELSREGIPVLSIGRCAGDWPYVDTDNAHGAYEAVKHLIGLGHKKIAHLAGKPGLTSTADRLAGYRRALTEAGLRAEKAWEAGGNSTKESGFQAMHRLLTQKELPTAVFAFNDAMAIGAIKAIRQKGLKVPEDLAVVGYGDDPVASYVDPPLTTIRQPMFEMGVLAAEKLVALTEGGKPGGETAKILLKPKLVIRESCGSSLWLN